MDGTKRVHCVVSQEALEDAARIEDADGRELEIFGQFAMEIDAAVNRKYDLGQIEPDGKVIIRPKDLKP